MAEVVLKAIKRGDGFSRACVYKVNGTPTTLAGFDSITGMIRDSAGTKLGDLVITAAEDQEANAGLFVIAADPNPPDWPIDLLRFDLQFTVAGIPRSTKTLRLPVEPDETHG